MNAAVVAKLTGKAVIIRGSESLPLALDSELQTSDSVRTEAGAKVELLFTDGATIELGPSTQVELKDFVFDLQGANPPSFVMHMLEGAVRSVSGKVVEQNPEAFKLTSPLGAVGIRGTSTLHLIYANHEVHVVQDISGNHTVQLTTPDGRSITMTGSALGVTITSGDFSPLVLQNISPGEMQDLLKIWLEDNKASESMQRFAAGETADLIHKLAALFIDGHLGVDTLDANSLVSALAVDSDELLPLAISETEDLDPLGTPFLVNPPSSEPLVSLNVSLNVIYGTPGDDWLLSSAGADLIYGFSGNDFIWTDAGNDTVYGGYGSSDFISSDFIVKPYSMSDGTILCGDEDILPAGAIGDDDCIIVGAVPELLPSSTFPWPYPTIIDPYNDSVAYGPGDMYGGVIYGDARIMEAGSTAGNDLIIVHGDMYGGVIFPDAAEYTGAVTGASNEIYIYGNMYGGTIHCSEGGGGGYDYICIGYENGDMYGGAIYCGDRGDCVRVVGNMFGGEINGGAGNDIVMWFGDMRGVINGGAGNDSIDGFSMSGGTINGGAGNDVIQVTSVINGTINGGAGNDFINVSLGISGGTIDGGDGDDTIYLVNANGGIIRTGSGTDLVSIGTLSGTAATVECGSGIDSITIQNVDNGTAMTINNFNSTEDVLDLTGTGNWELSGLDTDWTLIGNGGTSVFTFINADMTDTTAILGNLIIV